MKTMQIFLICALVLGWGLTVTGTSFAEDDSASGWYPFTKDSSAAVGVSESKERGGSGSYDRPKPTQGQPLPPGSRKVTISGKVKGEDTGDKGIAGATVKATGPYVVTTTEKKTDENGNYQLDFSLSSERKTIIHLEASAEGYETGKQDINVMTQGTPIDEKGKDFVLVKLTPKHSTIVANLKLEGIDLQGKPVEVKLLKVMKKQGVDTEMFAASQITSTGTATFVDTVSGRCLLKVDGAMIDEKPYAGESEKFVAPKPGNKAKQIIVELYELEEPNPDADAQQ